MVTRAGYSAATRDWAIDEYRKSRGNYGSRSECVAALALSIGAHENTVTRWIKLEFGPSRAPSAEETHARLRAAEAELERLRSENRSLSERLATVLPRSITADAAGGLAL